MLWSMGKDEGDKYMMEIIYQGVKKVAKKVNGVDISDTQAKKDFEGLTGEEQKRELIEMIKQNYIGIKDFR